MSNIVTEREQRLIGMANDLLISLDKIAVSRNMGFTRAEAIRAIEDHQRDWRGWKKKYIWDEPIPTDEPMMEYEGTLIPIYRPVGENK